MNKEYATGLVAVIKERFLFSHTHFETEAQTVDDTARLHNQQHTNSNSGSESVSSNTIFLIMPVAQNWLYDGRGFEQAMPPPEASMRVFRNPDEDLNIIRPLGNLPHAVPTRPTSSVFFG